MNEQAIALLIDSQESALGGTNLEAGEAARKIGLSYGSGVQNCLQKGDDIDLNLKLEKAPLKRRLDSEQLYSGQMRIDMGQPMTKGNLIVFKGDKRASGK